jgi:hypothetical protein
MIGLAASSAMADPKVDQDQLDPDGQGVNCSASPLGDHIAILMAKGSRYVVSIDGVEGPKIDGLLVNTAGIAYQAPSYWGGGGLPVLFSNDGSHNVYFGKVGNEYVVVLDGKELSRGPIAACAQGYAPMFSAGGKHLFYWIGEGDTYRTVVDGKPGPAMHLPSPVAMSADGLHYAYVSYGHTQNENWTVVDGRQVNFFGDNLQYSGRDVLLSNMSVNNTAVLLLNGKPEVRAAALTPMWMSPDGSEIAIVVTPQPGAPTFLTINGKTVAGTEGLIVEKVYFSPDGKRWAALCDTKTGSKFMVIDGVKGEEYQLIQQQNPMDNNDMTHWRFVANKPNGAGSDFTAEQPVAPGFTADSSKFVYVAAVGGRQFLIVDGEESNAFNNDFTMSPTLSATGHRVGVIAVTPNGDQHLLIDGKDKNLGPGRGTSAQLGQLLFSPGAAHYSYLKGSYQVFIDDVAQPGMLTSGFVVSPDGEHVAYAANNIAGANGPCFIVDGKIICKTPRQVVSIFFSPDSQHIYWSGIGGLQAQGTKDSVTFFADGKPVLHYSDPGFNTYWPISPVFSSDGSVTFFARTDGNLRRYHVTSDTSLAGLLASSPVAK